MRHKLTVTDEELRMILAALAVCTPSGGGGVTFSLLRRLMDETGEEVDFDTWVALAQVTIREAVQAGVALRLQ